MPLDVEQMEQVKRFFRSNMVVPDCPYCSGYGWKAGEIVAAPVVDERGNARPEDTSATMVQIVCDNCGHVTFFDARRLGLVRN
jgi:hypothetical protein